MLKSPVIMNSCGVVAAEDRKGNVANVNQPSLNSTVSGGDLVVLHFTVCRSFSGFTQPIRCNGSSQRFDLKCGSVLC